MELGSYRAGQRDDAPFHPYEQIVRLTGVVGLIGLIHCDAVCFVTNDET